jgi:hypothetical protein
METQEIKKRVDELHDAIKKAEEELNLIRIEKCSHPKSEIVNVNKNPGQCDLGKVCSTCGEYFGYPTKEEMTKAGY